MLYRKRGGAHLSGLRPALNPLARRRRRAGEHRGAHRDRAHFTKCGAACVQRRAGGAHVVDQDDRRQRPRWSHERERSLQVSVTFGAIEAALFRRVAPPSQPMSHGDALLPRERGGEQRGRIEPTLGEPQRMSGDWDQHASAEIDGAQLGGEQLNERLAHAQRVLEFPTCDRGRQRATKFKRREQRRLRMRAHHGRRAARTERARGRHHHRARRAPTRSEPIEESRQHAPPSARTRAPLRRKRILSEFVRALVRRHAGAHNGSRTYTHSIVDGSTGGAPTNPKRSSKRRHRRLSARTIASPRPSPSCARA